MTAAPDYCEPVIGWRAWRAVENRGEIYLMSLFHRIRWPWLHALAGRCEMWQLPWHRHRTRHRPPSVDCECGIYASTLEIATDYAPTVPPRAQGPYAVVGNVALWGDVIEYTEGWRASFAYPTRLYVLFPGSSRARRESVTAHRVAAHLERYGVPVDVIHAWKPRDVIEALSRRAGVDGHEIGRAAAGSV